MADPSRPPPDVIDFGSDDSDDGADNENGDDNETSADDAISISDDDSDSGVNDPAGARDKTAHDDDDFRGTLLDALDSICYDSKAGTVAHSAPIDKSVFKDPQIHVDGIGRIPLPLSAEHAEIIAARCDKGVLKPDAFRVENPLWEQRIFLAECVQHAELRPSCGSALGRGRRLRRSLGKRCRARSQLLARWQGGLEP